jgi:putative tricarboxylic transport membrane protein
VDLLGNLSIGFGAALTWTNLLFALTGCLLGTLIGVLPGIGPVATIAMLLPFTFSLDPLSSLIMLAGIYYGSQYGGSTTSILVNMPGEATSVVTCIDGHQMARQGRAGPALAVAALGSFFAGSVGTLLVAGFGPLFAALARQFNSADYFALMVLGLISAIVLAHGSLIKAIGATLVGILFGLVGTDVNSGLTRYTFDIGEIWDGIDFLPVAIGIFGVVEIIRNLEQQQRQRASLLEPKVGSIWPTMDDFRRSRGAVLRGTGLGSLLGILPGGGVLLSSFASYAIEKRVAADPSRFGHGAIEGVAGPESANNAAAQTSFIPLLTLGLPSNAVMAVMMGAMMIHGIVPGAAVMTQRPELFWGMIASMWIGNLMLVVINLPLLPVWVKLLSVPYRLLYPSILAFGTIGVFATTNSSTQMVIIVAAALFGYTLLRFGCEPAPFILGFLLGPLMEENLRRALFLSSGSPAIFWERPISAILLAGSAALVVLILVPNFRSTRERLS